MSDTVRKLAQDVADHLRFLEETGVRELAVPILQPEPVGASVDVEAKVEASKAMKKDPAPQPGRVASSETLDTIREDLGECTRCRLHETRNSIVFGVGNPKARLMFVGEAPGADEDEKGEPFVGRAGKLLDRIIIAMGLQREDVYIANVLKCRPPQNRNPAEDEIEPCSPFLRRQIASIAPEVLVALGAPAAKTLLETGASIGKLRGKFWLFQGIDLMPTYHPAYLLRNPSKKREVWEDMQQVMERLGLEAPPAGSR